jgi:ribose transport system permease protein
VAARTGPRLRLPALLGRHPGLLAGIQQSGLAIALAALVSYFTFVSPRFLTSGNVAVILEQVSVLAIVAVPGAMLLLAGYVDLSVGSVAGLSAIVFGEAIGSMPLGAAVVVALLSGAAWGALNGFLISYLAFSPIIVTLGGFTGAAGLASLIQHGNIKQGFGSTFGFFGNGDVAGVSVPVLVMILAFVVGAYVWYCMPVGRHIKAIGGERDAAFANGVAVKRIPLLLYVASGACAALGGLIIAAEIDSASIDIGVGMELQVLTAILLGGVSFEGGRGSLVGVAIGVLFMGALNNGLIVVNVGPYYANIAIGAVLVLAAGLDATYRKIERVPVTAAADADPALDAPPPEPLPASGKAER